MKSIIALLIMSCSFSLHAQTDLNNILKGAELLVNGLSFIKGSKTSSSNSKNIESICVKNKLADKITFKIEGKDIDENNILKELVIQKDGKECLLELSKGIYTYQIILSNNEVYKKGEYKFDETVTITVK